MSRIINKLYLTLYYRKMGGQVCKTTNAITFQDPLVLTYGKDDKQHGMEHKEQITFVNKQNKENKEIMKILSTYTQNLRNQKSLYKDPTLSTDPVVLKSKSKSADIKCTYQRPYKFLDHGTKDYQYKIIDFHDSQASYIEVKDQVMQYFGVFLCFLANKPNLIQKIICTNQNSYGIHCIQAFKEGRPIAFFIDDFILCRQKSVGKFEPVFSQPQKNMYMWPCLLEKAWFKIKGASSKRVQQNLPEQVFETFLSIPIQKIYLNEGLNFSSRETLNRIFSSFDFNQNKDKGFICRSKKNPEHDIGLSGARYFYLLDTFIDQGRRMFYLRNPTGQMHFRGMHDQISIRLQNIILKKFAQIAPGNFIVDQQQFIQQMGQLLIINYQPGNKITQYRLQIQNEQQLFIGFDLKYKSLFNLCLSQSQSQTLNNLSLKTKSFYPIIYHVVRLSDMKLIGGQENKEGCFGVKNTYLLDRFNQDAVSSKYIIRIKKKRLENIPNIQLFLIGYYIQQIKFQLPTQFQLAEKWKEFLKSEGVKQLALSQQSKQDKPGQIAHVVCWIGDIVFIYIEKRSKRNQVSIQVNFPQLMNLECISHPEIRRSTEWKSYKFTTNFLIIFQKIDLTAETHIRQYHIEAY